MTLFKGRYRSETTRLQSHNYAGPGYYFVTLCTKNRMPWFGKIVNGEMIQNILGQAADYYWRAIPGHFPFVELDAFVIMPDHVHGILYVNVHDKNGMMPNVAAGASFGAGAQNFVPLRRNNQFGPQSKNLASIIRGFKIGVTKYAKTCGVHSVWQPLYHDSIIRDQLSLHRIRRYIQNNPANWQG
ncbi:MAG: hypothetical protein KBD00_04570 [Candidatus Peribacteraceae bacterium]|nr:hypothetical protein [Candidatus Peribacteraceae bacterium]